MGIRITKTIYGFCKVCLAIKTVAATMIVMLQPFNWKLLLPNRLITAWVISRCLMTFSGPLMDLSSFAMFSTWLCNRKETLLPLHRKFRQNACFHLSGRHIEKQEIKRTFSLVSDICQIIRFMDESVKKYYEMS